MSTAIIALILLSITLQFYSAEAWTNPYFGTTWNNPTSSLAQTMIMNNIMSKSLKNNLSQGRPAGNYPSSFQGERREQRTPDYIFQATPRKIMPKVIADRMSDKADRRREWENTFIQFIDSFEQNARREHLPHNLVYAISFFIWANYSVAKNGISITDDQQRDLYRMIAPSFANNADLKSMSDLQKQGLYETRVIEGMFALVGFNGARERNDIDAQKKIRKFAMNNLKAAGISYQQIHLTRQGWSIKKAG